WGRTDLANLPARAVRRVGLRRIPDPSISNTPAGCVCAPVDHERIACYNNSTVANDGGLDDALCAARARVAAQARHAENERVAQEARRVARRELEERLRLALAAFAQQARAAG